jgi:nucleotide-binding universal stress UspA family protein
MKRILVPIDFSDAAPRVIAQARELAKALDTEIHLVHVKELTAATARGTLGYGLVGMPELAPMSGVPATVFDPMQEALSRVKVRNRSWLNGKKKSLKTASRSVCTSRLERWPKKS